MAIPAPQKLPIGIVDFKKLRAQGYIYVDKTKLISQLAQGSVFNFITRPRRFGKSLLQSTLYHLFSGHRNLFEGLWVAHDDRWNWQAQYPVLRIDFNAIIKVEDALPKAIADYLDAKAKALGVTLSSSDPGGKFQELIYALKAHATLNPQGHDVVLLIDEYDKAIVNALEESQLAVAQKNRETLRNFYTVLKSNEIPLQFVLLTGVSKFGRLSIFSDLNQFRDLSLHEDYATLLGYTWQEIEHYFNPQLARWAASSGLSLPQLKEGLKHWYNGYSWNGQDFVFTPWSVLNALEEKEFSGYWSASGTPKMLIDLTKAEGISFPSLEGKWVTKAAQDKTSLEGVEAVSLFWQTGYLTVKERQNNLGRVEFKLGLPNYEVQESLSRFYLAEQGITAQETEDIAILVNRHLANYALNDFFEVLGGLLAKVPYQLYPHKTKESYYHAIVYTVMMLSGHQVASEVAMAKGRIDMVLETPSYCYIFEFKLSSAQEALDQIKDRQYPRAYMLQNKKVIAVGVAFDVEQRTIGSWEAQEVAVAVGQGADFTAGNNKGRITLPPDLAPQRESLEPALLALIREMQQAQALEKAEALDQLVAALQKPESKTSLRATLGQVLQVGANVGSVFQAAMAALGAVG